MIFYGIAETRIVVLNGVQINDTGQLVELVLGYILRILKEISRGLLKRNGKHFAGLTRLNMKRGKENGIIQNKRPQ